MAGLGNPSNEYENTYHNIGLTFINTIASNEWKKIRGKHFIYTIKNNIIFIKPMLFMNENGIAVTEALKYFKNKPSELLIIHDDSDIYWNEYKIDFNKGSAGHNGVQSVIKEVGTKGFWRLRLGIREDIINHKSLNGDLPQKQIKASDFVLNKLKTKHTNELSIFFTKITKELEPIFISNK